MKNLHQWEPPEGAVFAYDLNTRFPKGFDPASKDWLKLNLSKTDLRGADLRNMDLRGVKLPSYPDLDLDGADLRGAHLGGQDLREAKNLEKANWDGAYIDLKTSFKGMGSVRIREEDINRKLILELKSKVVLDLRNKDVKEMLETHGKLQGSTFA